MDLVVSETPGRRALAPENYRNVEYVNEHKPRAMDD